MMSLQNKQVSKSIFCFFLLDMESSVIFLDTADSEWFRYSGEPEIAFLMPKWAF